jgi:hypothetical protein
MSSLYINKHTERETSKEIQIYKMQLVIFIIFVILYGGLIREK